MKRTLALLLAALMMFGLLAGCSGGEEEVTSTEPSTAPSSDVVTRPSEEPDAESEEPTEVELPLVDDTYSFDYWIANSNSFENFATYDDNEFYKWMEERTNVHLNFNHPPVGSERENFQTMVLSNDYPDFVQGVKSYYDGGVDKAIQDGFLQPLNDAVDQWMPNYRAVVYRDDETFMQCVSDSGNLWGVHHIVDRAQGAFLGLGVRSDWLDKLGMTVEDLETVAGVGTALEGMVQFTSENVGPLWLGNYSSDYGFALNGSWNYSGVSYFPYINVDGTATYGAYVGLKEYAAQMADWYAKGLINKSYIAEAAFTTPQDKWINSEVGIASFVYTMAGMYASLAANSDVQPAPDFHISAITTPKLNADDDWATDIHLRQQNPVVRNSNSMGITTQCSDLELACRYWDYAWSDEGKIASNWGEQLGEYGDATATYYIDETDANGDGHVECYQPWLMEKYQNVTYVQTKYAVHNGPTYSIWSREWCTLSEEEIGYTVIWERAGSDWVWPEGVTLTSEEGAEASSIVANANTAVSEWLAKVITGEKSVETYDTELIPTIEGMNIARATELYQAALSRYNDRVKFIEG